MLKHKNLLAGLLAAVMLFGLTGLRRKEGGDPC